MKKKIILLPLVGLLLYVVLTSNSTGPAANSSLNGTGSNGVNGCSCHNPSSTSTTTVGIVLLSGSTAVTSYVPGNTYTIRITGTQTSSSFTLPYYGYQVSTVKASGAGASGATQAGTLTAPSGSHSTTLSGLAIIEQNSRITGSTGTGGGGAGTIYTQDISWTAPIAGTGDVKIYGVINAVNGDSGPGTADKWNNTNITICEMPASITGTASVCVGATTTLTSASGTGTWTSTATGTASVSGSGSTATVTGVAAGTATISYTNTCGDASTVVVTVNTAPTSVTSSTSSFALCQNANITLTGAPTGGTWTSTGGGFAAVNSTTGLVTGTAGGVSTISYTLSTGCAMSQAVTVNALPSAGTINPTPSSGCIGSPVTMTNPVSGGIWTVSSGGGFATINSTSGAVTGTSAGPVIVSYTVTSSAGCVGFTSRTLTVNASPAATTGTATVCVGGTTTLSNATPGGTWSAFTGTGSVSLTPSGTSTTVTGLTAGTASVSYTVSGCASATVVTVDPLPSAGTISGISSVCLGGTSTYSVSAAGGTWTSSASGTASVAGSGTTATVTGMSLGTATISYTVGSGACTNTATKSVTVLPTPSGISGTLEACQGASSTLSGTPTGGNWSSASSNVSVNPTTGAVLGINAGTATITYSVGSCSITEVFTVNASPSVAAISGGLSPCLGTTVSYTDATPGGTWATTGGTGSIGLAAAGTAVSVTGLGAGTANLTYSVTNGFGCTSIATKTVTVNAPPSAITGTLEVCAGSNTVLTGAGMGSWSSSATGIANVTSPGFTSTVSGVSGGNATIAFTLTATGCTTTSEVTVNPTPSAIAGTPSVCIGETTSLASTPAGGTWSSSNTAQATVDASGIVTGMGTTASTPTITYTLPTSCRITRTITVNINPVITGASGTCVGSSVNLTGSPAGGTWSTGSPEATVSGSGVVTGVSLGTAIVTYTLPTGCIATRSMTIVAGPTDFSGTPVCSGATLPLSSTPTGGTWTSSNPSVASVGFSSGIVNGGTAGVANITYTVGGCSLVKPQTVNASPAAIAGSPTVCEGASITLNSATAGGTWSSVPGTGSVSLTPSGSSVLVTGTSMGTVTISYSLSSGCGVAKALFVNAAPAATGGTANACVGLTTMLTNTVPGGTWSSSNTARATVGSLTGIVTGVSAGTANISYTLPGGCFAVAPVTVNPSAPISGLTSLCTGTSTTLTNAMAGGTWASSNTGVASIGATSGLMTALAPGTTTISYTLSTGCAATITVTVISSPSPITGNLIACVGFTAPLTSPGGGIWTSSNTIVARIGSNTGIVTGVSLGTATISYSLGSGCTTTSVVTVSPNPAAVVGGNSVCEGSCLSFTDATPGGIWSIVGTTATITGTGLACGTSAGLAIVSYTLPTGCAAAKTITVNGLPNVITGTMAVCAGNTTVLSSLTPGGVWTNSNPTVASVGSGTGMVNGIAAGTTTIGYTIGGCTRTAQVTVNALPGTISGPGTACVGQTNTYSIATTGGTWSLVPMVVATVNSTSGDVTGIAAGSATLVYTSAEGCISFMPLAINVPPVVSAITGTTLVCENVTTPLADATAGGAWSSGSTATATVNSSGVVTGVAAGTTDITYTVTTSGCSSFVTTMVTVDPAPLPITGTLGMCVGAGTTLSDATPGGAWSSSVTGIATVGSGSGAVAGLAAGTSVISYTGTNGCSAWATVTVHPIPSAGTITIPSVVCMSTPTTLTSSVPGGVWSSAAVSGSATIGSSSGIVTGTSTGTADITYTYTSAAGCTNTTTTTTITVNPLPTAGIITGATNVCPAVTITLSNATAGGVWSSSGTWANVGSASGVVTGVTTGVETITYTVTNSCGTISTTYPVTVDPLPFAGTIGGSTAAICPGQTTNLTSSVSGGAWSSSTGSVASVSGTGVVTGIAGGTTVISYSVTNSCGTARATFTINVTPLPNVGAITGPDSVCVGDTIYMANSVPGGIWGNATGRAAVSSTGVVIGMVGGIDTVKYFVINACGSSAVATRVVKVRDYGVCHPVGVSPVPEMAGNMKVYPNPSAGIFTVEIPTLQGQASISVIDVLGKVVDTKVTNTEKTLFNLNNLAAGTYMVRVNMDGNTYRQAIVIH